MAILRLATKYEIRHLRTRALHHLNVFLPTTPLFKGWRDLGNRVATFPDILAAKCPDILADARECNAPFLAPACAYNLVCAMRDAGELRRWGRGEVGRGGGEEKGEKGEGEAPHARVVSRTTSPVVDRRMER